MLVTLKAGRDIKQWDLDDKLIGRLPCINHQIMTVEGFMAQ
jgi:hypothetical protein